MKHSDGSTSLIAKLDCNTLCSERIHYYAPVDDSCTIKLEGATAAMPVITVYTEAPAIKIQDVNVGTPQDLSDALFVSDNPFQSSTTIELNLNGNFQANLRVVNVLGETMAVLVSSDLSAGHFEYPIDAKSWPSGVYFVRLEAGNNIITKQIVKLQ